MKNNIIIKEERLTSNQYIDFLKRSDLGAQYPQERFDERINKLVANTSISLVARNKENMIVGVLFALSDFSYFLFITDLGVDRDYERMGIGSSLIKHARELAGGEKDIAIVLVANDKAIPFYDKIGMKKANDVMHLSPTEWTDWIVK